MFRRFLPVIALAVAPVAATAATPAGIEVTSDLRHDESTALRDLRAANPLRTAHALPWRRTAPAGALTSVATDAATQLVAGKKLAAVAGLNLEGVGQGFKGPQGTYSDQVAPPDTNGAVGDTQVVEWVNTAFAVFDKATGKVVQGPINGNALWAGFGGGCETNNDGDIIVLFDKQAHRWFFSQFSVSSTPFLTCIAVSKTNDATGAYYRYSFQQSGFNDYSKFGTWPDAFYLTFNNFGPSGSNFIGPKLCALDKAKMLTGAKATEECKQLSPSTNTILPADLDGATPPPAGAPNYMLSYATNELQLFKFHADFAKPKNAKVTGPINIPVAAFTPACNGGTCIPQAGTSQTLDSLADRLMFRVAYRNYASASPAHESLVVTHSVTPAAPSKALSGVRWYEIRSPGTTPTVYQQSTYAPDSTARWQGSAAMDKVGDMLVGFSASSKTVHPAIRVTGRLATDPLNTLAAEVSVIAGAGSQTGGLNRWGDYTAMSVDPTDDCTFWYFNEYEKVSGQFNWNTRLASFKFPACK